MAKKRYDVLGEGKTKRLVHYTEKRRLVCSCGKSEVAYGSSSALVGISRKTECWDCGELRRKKEEEAKARKITRLMHDKDET